MTPRLSHPDVTRKGFSKVFSRMILAVPQNLFGSPVLTTKIVALFLAALSEAAWITGQGFLPFSPR